MRLPIRVYVKKDTRNSSQPEFYVSVGKLISFIQDTYRDIEGYPLIRLSADIMKSKVYHQLGHLHAIRLLHDFRVEIEVVERGFCVLVKGIASDVARTSFVIHFGDYPFSCRTQYDEDDWVGRLEEGSSALFL